MALWPEHKEVFPLSDAETPGKMVTVAATVVVPQLFVTTAEYVVVEVGFTTMEGVSCPPGIHEYVPPPDAVSVTGCPAQMLVLPDMVAEDDCRTTTVIFPAEAHELEGSIAE